MTTSVFIQRLTKRMKEKAMTMAELSRVSGVPYHQIHTWKRRETAKPTAESLQKVAIALETTSGHLLNGDPNPEDKTGVLEELKTQLSDLSEEELRVLLAAAEAMRAQPPAEES
ncbi:MAG: helix-turn-helix transcriptional regulator [Thalassovita sp.]